MCEYHTGFSHCRNAIQAARRIVGDETGMKKSNAQKKKITLEKDNPERY